MATLRYTAALGIAGLIVPLFSGPSLAADYVFNSTAFSSLAEQPNPIIEIAGADEGDKATKQQLRDAGTEMIPDSNLKKSSANPKPIKLMAEPKKLAPAPATPEPPAMQAKPVSTPAPMPEQQMTMTSINSGPYIRLDVGFAYTMDSDGSQSAGSLTNGKVDNTAVIGGGLGYRINQNFRTDNSLDYRFESDVSATTAAGNTASTEVDAMSIMVNGYWDVMKLDIFTPYVGAGLGYAHLSTSTQTTTGGIANESGDGSDNLAWAVIAGSSIELNSVVSIDLNYRFTDLGEFSQATSTNYDNYRVHEARAGLRYSF